MSKIKACTLLPLILLLTACAGAHTDDKVISTVNESPLDEDKLTASDFSLLDQYGNSHSLSQYRGKSVVLIFWATWCSDCMEELPDIEKLYAEYQNSQEGPVILGVNTLNREPETDIAGVADFMRKNSYTFPTLMDEDGKVFEAYNIRTYPTTYIISSEGEIIDCIKEVIYFEDILDKST